MRVKILKMTCIDHDNHVITSVSVVYNPLTCPSGEYQSENGNDPCRGGLINIQKLAFL